MTKAAELAKMGEVITNGQVGGRRNLIINGNFQNWQRSTSETGLGASAGYFTADRWRISTANSAGRFTMNRTAGDPDGFNYGLVINCTTADTSVAADEILLLQQKIEGQDVQHLKKGTSDAESVTISFYAKIVGSATDFVVTLYDNDNNRFISKLFTFTTSWVRYYFTVPGDTTGTLDQDTSSSLEMWFWLHAGSNHTSGTLQTSWGSDTNANRAAGIDSIYSSTSNEFYLTGCQLEVGGNATEFEHRSHAEELALCQRYGYRLGGLSKTYQVVGNGFIGLNASTICAKVLVHLPTTMRTNPSVSVIGTDSFIGHTGAAFSDMSCTLTSNQGGVWNDASSGNQVWLDFGKASGGSPTNGTACVVYTAATNQGEVFFNAEM